MTSPRFEDLCNSMGFALPWAVIASSFRAWNDSAKSSGSDTVEALLDIGVMVLLQ